nr:hybrid sensor histidine kinase/response regulator [uncultured Carboxylicivirga sp.]
MKSSVLVVDDNPKNLQVLAALLYENNYDVEVASSGIDAIKWVNQTAFDLILLDIMMPDMDGFETGKKIKSDNKFDNIPIIFITARHDIESIEEGFKVGGVDYITKPFNQSELLVRVKNHIELKKSREKLLDVNKWLKAEVSKKTIELQNTNEQLIATNEQLSKLDEAKNYFLNSISHEIRTPLNGIVGALSLLQAYDHDENVIEIINLLDSSIKKLENYSYSALQISHLHLKGDSQLVLKPINLATVLDSTLNQFKKTRNEKNITFTFDSKCPDCKISADYMLIQKAITALLECSYTFTHDGEIKIVLSIESNNILVAITDTGSFYDDIKIQHFFNSIKNQNYQFKRNNSIELYLANVIVLLHKGQMELNNLKNEQGTCTMLSFPIYENVN